MEGGKSSAELHGEGMKSLRQSGTLACGGEGCGRSCGRTSQELQMEPSKG